MEKHNLGLNPDREFEETMRAAKESTEEKADSESEAKSNVPAIMKLLDGAALGINEEWDCVTVPLARYDELIKARTERDIVARLISVDVTSYELQSFAKAIFGTRQEGKAEQ